MLWEHRQGRPVLCQSHEGGSLGKGHCSRDQRKLPGSLGRSHGICKGSGVERNVGCSKMTGHGVEAQGEGIRSAAKQLVVGGQSLRGLGVMARSVPFTWRPQGVTGRRLFRGGLDQLSIWAGSSWLCVGKAWEVACKAGAR